MLDIPSTMPGFAETTSKAMFKPHPSPALNEHFVRKPYQGTEPEDARFLFIGLDANYASNIEQSPIFPSILRYHDDGPGFWRTTGVHHPFLLPGYRGDGRRYHQTFGRVGFQPRHADLVSFLELLHVPTVGRSVLVAEDLRKSHLERIRHGMFAGNAKFVFVSAGVQRLLVATGMFPEVRQVRRNLGALRVLHESEDRAVFLHLHFSNYGKFEQQLRAEASAITGLLACDDA
ncbi:hypothetical protein [Stenotrophomonas sp. NLF4-10]|uniref:hypothetical protein n=1 Tax=Stenotrophomonas sp. NLF4-10 TaxID=2918754 RepID=UPI001EFBA022|nr:hypothetical protein [Stenotrophomonas sp. NLF4-10]MCG8277832.1 hypothetical protein [Stenotrophomonas sp. NLF4-10]